MSGLSPPFYLVGVVIMVSECDKNRFQVKKVLICEKSNNLRKSTKGLMTVLNENWRTRRNRNENSSKQLEEYGSAVFV